MTRSLVLAAALGLSMSGAYAACNSEHLASKVDETKVASIAKERTSTVVDRTLIDSDSADERPATQPLAE